MYYGNNVDFNRFQALNFRFQNLGAAPSSPLAGMQYFDTALNTPRVWDGTAWFNTIASKVADGTIPLSKLVTDPLARANHTGTQVANTISNFDAQVRSSRLDQMAAPTLVVSLNGQVLSNLGTAVASTDAVPLGQANSLIDAARAGIRSKDAVSFVATTNIALTGLGTQGGGDWAASLTVGQSVLATGQTNAQQNGPYTVSAAAWVRRVADDAQSELVPGAEWLVLLGTTFAASRWVLRNTVAPIPGTDNLTISQSGAATAFTAGNGVDITGSVISAKTFASSGILLSGTGIAIDPVILVRKFMLTFGDGTATTFTFTHNLNTQDITYSIRRLSDGQQLLADLVPTGVNTATLTLAYIPTAGELRLTVHG